MKKVRLVLCRHTQTDYNKESRLTGQTDISLNNTGKTQAEYLATCLADKTVRAIYSSDLKRALETARYITRHHKLPIIQEKRLREVSLGQLEGLKKEEAYKKYPKNHFSSGFQGFDHRRFGGECESDVLKRELAFFAEIIEQYGVFEEPYPFIVIVGHGTALKLFVNHCGIEHIHPQGEFQIVVYPKNH